MEVPRTLIVTNDFPPRVGGVQQYVWNVAANLPPDRVAVLAPNWPGWRDHDDALPFPVHRFPTTVLWPSSDLAAKVRMVARGHGSEVVLFGHGLPLALLGPALDDDGLPYVVATHGTEYWFALTPVLHALLQRATSRAARVLAVSRFTGRVIRTAVPRGVPLSLLPPGVATDRFRPDAPGAGAVRARHGLSDRPLVLCVSRLVPRKGQDVLIRALPAIRRREPDAALLIVGDGPDATRLRALAADHAHAVVFAGKVPDADLPAYHAAADVFAVPCRSRLAGLEVEGFGIVFLEAAASGRPVVAGDAGGAAEAVADGETGLVVDGRHPGAVSEAVAGLLANPARSEAMGKAGRARVERLFTWPRRVGGLARWLAEASR